jgi:ribonuclease HI
MNVHELLTRIAASTDREITKSALRTTGAPVYATDPEPPGMIVQVLPGGTRIPGRLENRRFVAMQSGPHPASGEPAVMRYTFRVDASYDQERDVTGIGIVLSGTAKKTSRPGPTIEMRSEAYRHVPAGAREELAVLRALELAAERGYRRVRVYSDYHYLKRRLKDSHAKDAEADQDNLRGMVLRLAERFDECRFAWILRRRNGQAHLLARLGAKEKEPVARADIRW